MAFDNNLQDKKDNKDKSNIINHPNGSYGRQDGYLPIENYGLIGNMRNAALVGTDGSIDFWCYPKFDSPSVFCRILDQNIGGYFSIQPIDIIPRLKQQYLPNSNVLQTKFLANQGAVHITDLMPVPKVKNGVFYPWLQRTVTCMRGKLRLKIEVFPAFDYARTKHTTSIIKNSNKNMGKINKSSLVSNETIVFETVEKIPHSNNLPLVMDLRYIVSDIEDDINLEDDLNEFNFSNAKININENVNNNNINDNENEEKKVFNDLSNFQCDPSKKSYLINQQKEQQQQLQKQEKEQEQELEPDEDEMFLNLVDDALSGYHHHYNNTNNKTHSRTNTDESYYNNNNLNGLKLNKTPIKQDEPKLSTSPSDLKFNDDFSIVQTPSNPSISPKSFIEDFINNNDNNIAMDNNSDSEMENPTIITCKKMFRNLKLNDENVNDDIVLENSCKLANLEWHTENREGTTGPGVWAEFDISEGQRITFIFRERPPHVRNIKIKPHSKSDIITANMNLPDPELSEELINKLIMDTLYYWTHWINKSTYTGRWRETVNRSALTLKLLTYSPTGAVVAAPTFGLPEELGGTRNWDYRYTWIRDSSFTIYALIRIGMTDEAKDFIQFIRKCFNKMNPDGSLQVMYSIDSELELPEVILDHLEGYRKSPQVRIGNAATKHLQLDIYGELMDSMYLFSKYGTPISFDNWLVIRKMVNYVCNNWMLPDMSIWEVRGKKEQFLYSKIMCWVAVDRGLRFIEKRGLPCPERDKWLKTRDEIYFTIMERGYSKKHGCFLQTLDSHDKPILDASVLIMPLVFFISPGDNRLISTLKRIIKPPSKGGLLANNLMYRYDRTEYNDGVDGTNEGSFSMCTFWLIEALCRSGKYHSGLLRRSVLMFDQMITYGNHVQLFSEEVASTGEMLGNFPQAFTHIALVSAAFNLDRDLKLKHI